MNERIIEIIASPFKKMRVLHQVLLVVGIAVIFSLAQGALGVYTIRNLITNSQNIFDITVQKTVAAKDLQRDFSQVQQNYLSDMVKGDTSARTLFHNTTLTAIKPKLVTLEGQYPNQVELLKGNVERIQKIIDRPVTLDNYQNLVNVMGSIISTLDDLVYKIQDSTVDTNEKNKNDSSFAITFTIVLWIASFVLTTLFGLIIVFLIAKPLEVVGQSVNALASGNLTKTITAKGSVEVTKVIGILNQAIGGLRELVGGIHEQSNMIYIASQELKEASSETGKSAAEVAKAMEELSRASSEQADQTTQAVRNIEVLASLVRQVSNEMKNLSMDSQSVAQSAKLGQKATSDVANEINKIYAMSMEVTAAINELDKASIEISEIITVIEGIAEQTTLLALNAAIEAARAGEHGKGFAVVAKETGKLAEQSKQAVQLIHNLINQMKQRSAGAVQSMANGMVIVESGKNLASEAMVTFENIFNKLGNILERIDAVALSAKKMSESNESVITAVTSIATLSEESMASTEEVSATAEEQSASVEEVTALAENLAEIAINLKKSVSQFAI